MIDIDNDNKELADSTAVNKQQQQREETLLTGRIIVFDNTIYFTTT